MERKRLFGLQELESSQQTGLDIYTSLATMQTFERLRDIVSVLLEEGINVVLDSTFLHFDVRQSFYKLAEEKSVTVHIVSCQLDAATLRQRLMDREKAKDDASEANVAIMEQQLGAQEALTNNEKRRTYFVDMKDGVKALDGVLKELKREKK